MRNSANAGETRVARVAASERCLAALMTTLTRSKAHNRHSYGPEKDQYRLSASRRAGPDQADAVRRAASTTRRTVGRYHPSTDAGGYGVSHAVTRAIGASSE
jgi:hypothetical protein